MTGDQRDQVRRQHRGPIEHREQLREVGRDSTGAADSLDQVPELIICVLAPLFLALPIRDGEVRVAQNPLQLLVELSVAVPKKLS
ncbi:hypothetical protein [Nocardia sp. NPDC049149]|uniref:hypothetical protein n=1 Tax=Nocardia sp. NPDC049149 TaxID=3364315 RepID=UPI0037110D67